MNEKYVIGIDYGTDSARAVIADTSNGSEVATSVKIYPRWSKGLYCDQYKSQYRQHPMDYIDTLEYIVKDALAKSPEGTTEKIVGISFDTTGSTPVLIDKEGMPLALTKGFESNPNAMFVLWKDHTAVKEAEEINNLASKWETDYTHYEGGIYSSEWVWAKILHILRDDREVSEAAYSWIEHADWMSALLTGQTKPETLMRSRCAAGHKAMWHKDWGGLPSEEFLRTLDPLLEGFRNRLYNETFTSDTPAGVVTPEWAARLGLRGDVVVGVSAFDCHMGAVAGGIKPGYLLRAIGTSTCDIMIATPDNIGNKVIAGICGQVDGSVIPGYIGLEAGQSGFGDIYAWFKNVLAWPIEKLLPGQTEVLDLIIPLLNQEAAKIPIEDSTLLAIDWMNGRRTPDANQEVTGTIAGLNLSSTAPRIFRALVEATAFGSKSIAERFRREGVDIKGVVGLGGVAKKSEFVMQTMSDVMNMPIKVAATNETCALGAAMFAAVAAGVYAKVEDAQTAMFGGYERDYFPNPENVKAYEILYEKYLKLGEFTEKNL